MARSWMRLGVVLLVGGLFQGTAMAKERTAAWLFQKLVDQANLEARQARAGGHPRDAKAWEDWSRFYGRLAHDPRAQALGATRAAKDNIAYCRDHQAQLARAGRKDAADLYRVSAELWADLVRQLERGGAVTVRFSRAQMVKVIPGLEGTPWAGATQTRSSAHTADCQALAARVRACERQVSQTLSHSLTTVSDESTFLTVRRAQCNRAQELYLAQCEK